MMKKEYYPKTDKQKFGYLIEECGEVMQIIGKTMRWGLESHNPESPQEEQVTNRFLIHEELKDLKRAIRLVENIIDETEAL